jgi:hypothetical protein
MSTFKQGHALIIGIGNDLPITERDATDIAKVFADPNKAGYLPENVEVLTGKDATKENIEKGLDKLIAKTKDVDGATAVVYYSGHGAQLPWLNNELRYFLVPNDVNFEDIDTFLPSETFTDKINLIEADKLLVLLDCCHAEGQHIAEKSLGEAQGKSLGKKANTPIVSELNGGEGRVFIASCKDDEKSYISFGDSNSLFTKHLITALNGIRSQGYDYIHVLDIVSHLFRMVPMEAKMSLSKNQTPIINFADKLDANFFISANNNIAARNTSGNAKSKSLAEIEEIRKDVIENYNITIHSSEVNTTNSNNNTNNSNNTNTTNKTNTNNNSNNNTTIITNNFNTPPPSTNNPSSENNGTLNYLSEAKKLIAKNRVEQAIDLLINNVPNGRWDKYQDTVIGLSGQWNDVKTKELSGIAYPQNIAVSKARIKQGLLGLISSIEHG